MRAAPDMADTYICMRGVIFEVWLARNDEYIFLLTFFPLSLSLSLSLPMYYICKRGVIIEVWLAKSPRNDEYIFLPTFSLPFFLSFSRPHLSLSLCFFVVAVCLFIVGGGGGVCVFGWGLNMNCFTDRPTR